MILRALDVYYSKQLNFGSLLQYQQVYYNIPILYICLLSFLDKYGHVWASLIAQLAKNLLGMRETRVRSLGQEDPLEKGMATHSSSLAWEISWTEEPVRLQSMGSKELDTTE